MNYQLGQDVMMLMNHETHPKSLLEKMYDSTVASSISSKATTAMTDKREKARIILMGPSDCGKTSLLFHVAYSEAMTSTTGVLMIRHASSSTSTNFPCPASYHSNWKESSLILQNIKIIYISSLPKLLCLLSTTPPRTALILDDVHLFLHPTNINSKYYQEFRLILALSLDLVQHEGTMILSTTNTLMEVNNHYPYINTIAKITSDPSKAGSWNIQMNSLRYSSPKSTVKSKYQIITTTNSNDQNENTNQSVIHWE